MSFVATVTWRHPETARTCTVEGTGATRTAAVAAATRNRDALGFSAYTVRHAVGLVVGPVVALTD